MSIPDWLWERRPYAAWQSLTRAERDDADLNRFHPWHVTMRRAPDGPTYRSPSLLQRLAEQARNENTKENPDVR